jgi:hypothetical protein
MRQVQYPMVASFPTHVPVNEHTWGLVHWFRAYLYGECPECHGTHSKQVCGWNKKQCKDCGCIWNYEI